MASTITKTADMNGPDSLGPQVANRLGSVTQVTDSEYVLKLVRAIPRRKPGLRKPQGAGVCAESPKAGSVGKLKKGPKSAATKKLTIQLQE